MITITRQNDGVLFTFENSDKYLYGNGSILVPFNTLSIVADESDMITLKKAASNDVFISARYDTDLGYRSKDDAIDDLKDLLFAETGGGSESGITSGEVQTMIDNSLEDYYTDDEVDAALSGKASVSDVTAVANDVQTVSGQVATKVAITDFNAYSATTDARIAEDEEVTAAALNNLDETKQDALEFYSEAETEDSETGEIDKYGQIEIADELNGAHIYADYLSTNEEKSPYASIDAWVNDGEGNEKQNRVYAEADGVQIWADENADDGEGNIVYTTSNVSVTSTEIGMSVSEDGGNTTTTLSITSTGVTINDEAVATEPYVDAALSGKADTSAVTAAIDAATSGKVDTSAITSSITSGSTDAQVPSAKAAYDAITAATTGGGITVDSAFSRTSENPVQNKVISNSATNGNGNVSSTGGKYKWEFYSVGGVSTNQGFYLDTINGETVVKKYSNTRNLNLVETTAITSAMTSSSTDAQVPSAKAVYDTLGGLKFVKLTQNEYDQLATKDPDTLYIISNVVS